MTVSGIRTTTAPQDMTIAQLDTELEVENARVQSEHPESYQMYFDTRSGRNIGGAKRHNGWVLAAAALGGLLGATVGGIAGAREAASMANSALANTAGTVLPSAFMFLGGAVGAFALGGGAYKLLVEPGERRDRKTLEADPALDRLLALSDESSSRKEDLSRYFTIDGDPMSDHTTVVADRIFRNWDANEDGVLSLEPVPGDERRRAEAFQSFG